MCNPLLYPALLFSIVGGYFGDLKESQFQGVWTTSCDNILDNGLHFVYRANETFRPDGSFNVESEFWTYLPQSGRQTTYGSSTDYGQWSIEDGKLLKRYTRIQLEEYQSAIPQMGREDFEQTLEQLIQHPFRYAPKWVSGDRIVVYESETDSTYTMRRVSSANRFEVASSGL